MREGFSMPLTRLDPKTLRESEQRLRVIAEAVTRAAEDLNSLISTLEEGEPDGTHGVIGDGGA